MRWSQRWSHIPISIYHCLTASWQGPGLAQTCTVVKPGQSSWRASTHSSLGERHEACRATRPGGRGAGPFGHILPERRFLTCPAVLEQSKALTSLAAQIAAQHGDSMTELAGTSTTGTRGAAGGAKLQNELAMHRGTFFTAVLHQMGSSHGPYKQCGAGAPHPHAEGDIRLEVPGTFWWLWEAAGAGALAASSHDGLRLFDGGSGERCFGTTCRGHRTVMPHGGRMDLATLLTLQEDPPSSIFQNRQLSSTSRSRSFAPLADQRWVTCSLAFLERDGGDCVEASGAYRRRRKGHFRSFIRSAKALKGKATPKKKGKGRGQTAPEEVDGQ